MADTRIHAAMTHERHAARRGIIRSGSIPEIRETPGSAGKIIPKRDSADCARADFITYRGSSFSNERHDEENRYDDKTDQKDEVEHEIAVDFLFFDFVNRYALL